MPETPLDAYLAKVAEEKKEHCALVCTGCCHDLPRLLRLVTGAMKRVEEMANRHHVGHDPSGTSFRICREVSCQAAADWLAQDPEVGEE